MARTETDPLDSRGLDAASNTVAMTPEKDVANGTLADPALSPSATPTADGAGTSPGQPEGLSSAAFADLQRRKFQLELPGRGLTREPNLVQLAQLPVAAGESLQLALLGGDPSLKLVPQSVENAKPLVWNIVKKAKASLGGTEDVTVGRFLHQDGELKFQWDRGAAAWAKPGSCQFSLLEVRIGSERELCRLWKPLLVNPVRISTKVATTADVPLTMELLDRPETCHVQFQLDGLPTATAQPAAVPLGSATTVMLGEDPAISVELELKIVMTDMRSVLQAKLFGSPPSLTKDGAKRAARLELTRAGVQTRSRSGKETDSTKKRSMDIKTLERKANQLSTRLTELEGPNAATKNQNTTNRSTSISDRKEAEATSIRQQQTQLNAQLSRQQTELNQIQQLLNDHNAWCESVLGILDSLEERTQLRYAIFVEGPQRIPVVITSGFDWPTP